MSDDGTLLSKSARRMALSQRKAEKACLQCKEPFTAVLRAKYCSTVCSNKAYRERHREELNRKRREKYRKGRERG